MRKISMVIAIIAMCFGVVGCDGKNSNTESVISKNSVEEETSHVETAELQTTVAEGDEDAFYDWYGVNVYYPSAWEEEFIGTAMMWSGTMSSNDTIHYFVEFFLEYEGEKTGELSDVPTILNENVQDNITEKFTSYKNEYSCVVNNESETLVNGVPFLRCEGTVHTATNETSNDLNYVAYYGYLDFPQYDRYEVPSVWMAFSEAEEKDTLTDIATVVDKAAELLNWEE